MNSSIAATRSWHTMKDTATNPFTSNFSEPSFNQVQPGGTGRGKMKVKMRMFAQPLFDIGMIMRTIVIQDQVKVHSLGGLTIYLSQKFQEFHISMSWVTGADYFSIQDMESRKQTGRPIALIIMGHGRTTSFLHGRSGLRPVQGLYLRFFIHRQDDRFIRRIEVDPDHISKLLHQSLVLGQLESFHPMRLKTMSIPNPSHTGMAYSLNSRPSFASTNA